MTTILTEVNGFTPVIDAIVTDLGGTPALVFGMVWRFCQMESGTCTASVETIASRLNMDRKTAERHIKKLCAAGYLEDTTPDRKHAPHVYRDTGKARVVGSMQGKTKYTTSSAEVVQNVQQVGQNAPPRSGELHHLGGAKCPSKIPSKILLEDREKDTSSPPSADATAKPPPEPKPPSETILPDTPEARVMFAKLAANARSHSPPRRAPTRFGSLEQKRKFIEAVARLDGKFEYALDAGLGNGITAVGKLVNWLASPKWQEKQQRGNYGTHQQNSKARTGETQTPLPPKYNRTEVERNRKLLEQHRARMSTVQGTKSAET